METQGDVLIKGLQEIQTDTIIDVRFGDSDADPYRKEPMEKSWIVGRSKIKISMVITVKNNRNSFLCLSFQCMACLGMRH